MAPTFLITLGCSVAATFALQRLAPQYAFGTIPMTLLLLSVGLSLYATWHVVIYPRFFCPLRHLPTPPDSHFFTGHSRQIFRERAGRPQEDWIDNVPNDGLIRYDNLFSRRVLVTNPKVLGEVMVTKNYDFTKPPRFTRELARLLGVGILTAEGEVHKIQRKNLMPAFHYRHIKDLYPEFWDIARQFVQGVTDASNPSASTNVDLEKTGQKDEKAANKHAPGSIDVGHWSSRATLDVIGRTGMGQTFGALQDPDNKLSQTYRSILRPSKWARYQQMLNFILPFWIRKAVPTQRNSDLDKASEYIKQVCRELIAQKRKVMAEKKTRDIDIISVALESGGFTDEDLVNQMMTFLVAGHETTATAMIWAIYVLCQRQDIQQKLRDEIRSQLPSPEAQITAADIDGCNYLRAFCTEILRLWTPVALTIRVAACNTSLNGQFIPKGTVVILAPGAINRSKLLWGADAGEFKPERWLDADGKANNKGSAESNYSFMTFLHGPRSCIGQKFAQAEFECLLAAWAGRFQTDFEQGSPYKGITGEPPTRGGITIKPKDGLWVDAKVLDGW